VNSLEFSRIFFLEVPAVLRRIHQDERLNGSRFGVVEALFMSRRLICGEIPWRFVAVLIEKCFRRDLMTEFFTIRRVYAILRS
jgi:hypothetical protein